MADGECRFGVLGPLLFERDGGQVAVPSGRQRSLLALLLMSGGVPLSRDRLIDELWGERPPASAVSALHVHLSKLRELLGGLLELGSAGYALKRGAFTLDVLRFDELVEEARTHPDRAGALLREALGLFRGEPLCDVAAEGSVAQWRRELEEKRLQAILSRLDAELAAGAAGELVAELEQLVAQHQFEERLWGQLMVALYRAGRQAEALDAFQRARRLLAEELGLEPGEGLVRLQQQILDRDVALAARQHVTSPQPPPTRARSNLPHPPTPIIGRQRELAALQETLADPGVRLVTVTGPGGVGKTRLLLELATAQEPDYADGAAFIRLERLTDPALVAAEIATTIAQRDGAEGLSADGLASYVRDRALLLVIDNFEHLLPAAVLVAELLGDAPGMRVLASSRTALRVRGEHVFALEPLELPAPSGDGEPGESPAVQLFLQRARAADRRFEADASVVQTATMICRALDGLPLAIELAAARLGPMSLAAIEQQLARPLAIGAHALQDLPDRQQTLEATIEWSYDRLGPDAQRLLRVAGAFLGGCTRAALQTVAGEEIEGALDELLGASLACRQAGGERIELLELVRAFALTKLDADGQGDTVRERHRRYYAAAVTPTREALEQGALPGELAAPLLADHANLRTALENAIDAGDATAAVELALGLRALWFAGMLRQETREFVDRLLNELTVPAEDELRLLRAAAFVEGFSESAMALHERVAARAAELGDWGSVCTATCNLFGMAVALRNVEEMSRLRPVLEDLIRPQTSAKSLGWIYFHLATAAYVEGELDQAIHYASLSAEQAQEIGHEYLLATAFQIRLLAGWARDRVLPRAALAEGLDRVRRTGVKTDAVVAMWFVALYAACVEPDSAARWLVHAERILTELGSEIWPESRLRDETMALLGIADFAGLLYGTPPLDHAAALAAAAEWLSGRDASETAARAGTS